MNSIQPPNGVINGGDSSRACSTGLEAGVLMPADASKGRHRLLRGWEELFFGADYVYIRMSMYVNVGYYSPCVRMGR